MPLRPKDDGKAYGRNIAGPDGKQRPEGEVSDVEIDVDHPDAVPVLMRSLSEEPGSFRAPTLGIAEGFGSLSAPASVN